MRHARALGCRVIDRCNLTVLLLPALADLAPFLADQQVEIVASLPAPEELSTNAQRGDGTWQSSLEALRLLNRLGYGKEGSGLELTLMSNPAGEELQQLTPCDEIRWRNLLAERGGGLQPTDRTQQHANRAVFTRAGRASTHKHLSATATRCLQPLQCRGVDVPQHALGEPSRRALRL